MRSPDLIALFPNAPLRKIVDSTTPRRRADKIGMVALSTFECGHQDWTRASERRKGRCYCFDCFYGKPVSEQGKITLEVINGKA